MLIAADSAGRREALIEQLLRRRTCSRRSSDRGRSSSRRAPIRRAGKAGAVPCDCDSGLRRNDARPQRRERFCITVASLEDGFALTEPALTVLTERQLYGERAQQATSPAHARDPRTRGDPARPRRTRASARRSCTSITASAAIRACSSSTSGGRARRRVPLHRIREGRQALRAGRAAASRLALLGRRARTRAAAFARRRRLGEAPSARPRRRCATSPPNCSRCTRSAKRARAMRSPTTATCTSSSPPRFRSRKRRTSCARSKPSSPTSPRARRWTASSAATSASARPKSRCAPRSSPRPPASRSPLLVPTTLLAQQHYQNFRDRFADWPVRVEVISRFKSKKEVDAALKKLADGQIDVMIGTHRLLQPDVQVQGSRPRHRRRGAALRRAPEGSS